MSEIYSVLSPWADSNYLNKLPICPRLNTLAGKTIGLYASFKEYHPYFNHELERQLSQRFPSAKFSHYTYTVDTQEIEHDIANFPSFKEWLSNVDCVIGVGADMGSCSLYMGYNFAQIERLGKPSCLLSKYQYESASKKGASARGIPGLRMVTYDGPGFVPNGVDCNEWTIQSYRPVIASMLDRIVDALTIPLTESEKNPVEVNEEDNWAGKTFTGTLEELNDIFYEHGWTNGTPIIPPTQEAVDAMCTGTDLPRDCVISVLPPMNGKATVEKIAINGVMAGCTPTMMPILIGIAKALGNHDIVKLEGWTCSNAGWLPVAVISGPIRQAIGINAGRNNLSAYTRAQSCIARAMAYMIMNISGCRSQIEDMSGPGSDCRFGLCIAEDEENSPWQTLPADYGMENGENAVTLFWPSEHHQLPTANPSTTLERLCSLWHGGFDVGAMIILPPECAKLFADAGYKKRDILDYVQAYNRRPSSEIPRAAIGNNHPRKGLVFPAPGLNHSAPLFWNTDHMFVIVGGRDWGMCYLGGGDHGGPVCQKIDLPSNWEELTQKYPGNMPKYIDY
ncbi:MAG: hypothetical protein LUH36_02110 [Oscillospiraceae bacterium]|nr:hypothetical protein [Oscillospiraceae bacterium]